MKFDSVMVGNKEVIHSALSIYPNPVSTILTVDFKGLTGNSEFIEITDFLGRVFFTTSTSGNKIKIDVNSFPEGVWFLKMKTSESSYIRSFYKY